jgi:hypothetical protein
MYHTVSLSGVYSIVGIFSLSLGLGLKTENTEELLVSCSTTSSSVISSATTSSSVISSATTLSSSFVVSLSIFGVVFLSLFIILSTILLGFDLSQAFI